MRIGAAVVPENVIGLLKPTTIAWNVLPEELLIQLKNFAAGKLKRNELEEFSERLVSNNLAIETLALEIKRYWGPTSQSR